MAKGIIRRNKIERMITVESLLVGIYEEILRGDFDGDDNLSGLIQNAAYAQEYINRIMFMLNEMNGCRPKEESEAFYITDETLSLEELLPKFTAQFNRMAMQLRSASAQIALAIRETQNRKEES